jgi:hypothetical protein
MTTIRMISPKKVAKKSDEKLKWGLRNINKIKIEILNFKIQPFYKFWSKYCHNIKII